MSEATLEWVEAATLDDLWEGEMLDIEVAGQDQAERIILVHLPRQTIRAYQGICPHQQILLAEGELEENILTCSGHSWQFDVRTGEGVNPRGCQLYRYEVRLEGTSIFVGIPRDDERHFNRCRES